MRLAVLLLAAGCLTASPAAAGEPPRSVVELFTSQGCSSCPPADRLASELAGEGRTLVLTLPVDYWDYLGWKDTLASPAHSARQRAYALARGDRKVFTPQIVVNGGASAVGGDRAAVEAAISRAEGLGGLALPVTLEVEDGRIEVEVAKARRPLKEARGEVWAFGVQRSRPVEIGRGENAGRHVVYANVVRHMTRLGVWDGEPARFEIAADEVLGPDADGVAIIVQAGTGGQPGAVLGAARTDKPLPKPQPTTTSRLSRDPY
jgi:hypothetical protein